MRARVPPTSVLVTPMVEPELLVILPEMTVVPLPLSVSTAALVLLARTSPVQFRVPLPLL